MKECDLLRGSKHTLTPPTYFRVCQNPGNPPWIYILPCTESSRALRDTCSVRLQPGVGDDRESDFGWCEPLQRGAVGAGMSGSVRQTAALCRRRRRPQHTSADLLAAFQPLRLKQHLLAARNQPVSTHRQTCRRPNHRFRISVCDIPHMGGWGQLDILRRLCMYASKLCLLARLNYCD